MAETYSDSEEIECPHEGCDHTIRDLWDYEWGSREVIEIPCGACAKPVSLYRRVSVDYTAKPIEVTHG
jgi:hypothetical protein